MSAEMNRIADARILVMIKKRKCERVMPDNDISAQASLFPKSCKNIIFLSVITLGQLRKTRLNLLTVSLFLIFPQLRQQLCGLFGVQCWKIALLRFGILEKNSNFFFMKQWMILTLSMWCRYPYISHLRYIKVSCDVSG